MRSLALLKVDDLPSGISRLESPLDGESMHIIVSNAPRGIPNSIDNVAVFISKESFDEYYSAKKKGDKRLEL